MVQEGVPHDQLAAFAEALKHEQKLIDNQRATATLKNSRRKTSRDLFQE
jgi:hypothetical protein